MPDDNALLRGVGTGIIKKPDYFDNIERAARSDWDNWEQYPHRAGATWQLFEQVLSPTHVLSELLQNADDAQATWARVSSNRESFLFEHDGCDFTEEQFRSLCQFGYSNKRSLSTIGFRGIGFKSVFSLCDSVEVTTKCLAVRFDRERFYQPLWSSGKNATPHTRIAFDFKSSDSYIALNHSLAAWKRSPVPLMFFNSLSRLEINDSLLLKEELGAGPAAGSITVRLSSEETQEVLLIRSELEPIPSDCLHEIHSVRRLTSENELPPCSVQIVAGLHQVQRLYCVLPTDVELTLPFSANAPFLLDPSRIRLKPQSPTNNWLLTRIGQLAGKSMADWLGKRGLPQHYRAQAYELLPDSPPTDEDGELDASQRIVRPLADEIRNSETLLLSTGHLAAGDVTLAPPLKLYSVWSAEQLQSVFGSNKDHILSEEVSSNSRNRLRKWGLVELENMSDLVRVLRGNVSVPRPNSLLKLALLWSLLLNTDSFKYDHLDYMRNSLAIVPEKGNDTLAKTTDVVRLAEKGDILNEQQWVFLTKLVRLVDRDWIDFLSKDGEVSNTSQDAKEVLRWLELDRASRSSKIAELACNSLFHQDEVAVEDCVKFSRILSAMNVDAPQSMKYVTRDGVFREHDELLVYLNDVKVEEYLPEAWAAKHLISDAYLSSSDNFSLEQWNSWVTQGRSKLQPCIVPCSLRERGLNSTDVSEIFLERSGRSPIVHLSPDNQFDIKDYDFHSDLLAHWRSLEKRETVIWQLLLAAILRSPDWCWQNCRSAEIEQYGPRRGYKGILHQELPARWVVRFRDLACLPDEDGVLRKPAMLFLNTPQTSAMRGAEPFVATELDTKDNRPLLILLGVRDSLDSIEPLLDRLRFASSTADVAAQLVDVNKYCQALGRMLARLDDDEIERAKQAFQKEALIPTQKNSWARLSEVYLNSDDLVLPDALLVHDAIRELSLWHTLGVASRPTEEHLFEWLRSIESDAILDEGTRARLKSALTAFPTKVWNELKHWLSVNRKWIRTRQFNYAWSAQDGISPSDLHEHIRSDTADLSMLTVEMRGSPVFGHLTPLSEAIAYEPETNGVESIEPPVWVSSIISCLLKINWDEEEQASQIQSEASRLRTASWFKVDSLKRTPYLDQKPVGTSRESKALWLKDMVYRINGPLHLYIQEMAAELAKPFNESTISTAFRYCIGKDQDFIQGYMQTHFDLAETEQAKGMLAGEEVGEAVSEDRKEPVDSDEQMELRVIAAPPVADDDEQQGTGIEFKTGDESPMDASLPSAAASSGSARQSTPSIMARFAGSKGFKKSYDSNFYKHPDGSVIRQARELDPFPWCLIDGQGRIVTYYLTYEAELTKGVVFTHQQFEVMRAEPNTHRLILPDGPSRLKVWSSEELVSMLKSEQLKAYPASYRLRLGEGEGK